VPCRVTGWTKRRSWDATCERTRNCWRTFNARWTTGVSCWSCPWERRLRLRREREITRPLPLHLIIFIIVFVERRSNFTVIRWDFSLLGTSNYFFLPYSNRAFEVLGLPNDDVKVAHLAAVIPELTKIVGDRQLCQRLRVWNIFTPRQIEIRVASWRDRNVKLVVNLLIVNRSLCWKCFVFLKSR
jgi:hypothetical protein